MFNDESWNVTYFGVKRSLKGQGHEAQKNVAGVRHEAIVSAGFFYISKSAFAVCVITRDGHLLSKRGRWWPAGGARASSDAVTAARYTVARGGGLGHNAANRSIPPRMFFLRARVRRPNTPPPPRGAMSGDRIKRPAKSRENCPSSNDSRLLPATVERI